MDIARILREQDGLITRKQAREAGLTDAAIAHRVRRGLWDRVRPGVFLSREHVFTDRARVRADLLWLGPDATLVGVAAAWWWRLWDEPPAVVRVAVPAARHLRGRPGLVVERCAVAPGTRVEVDGVMVTSRARSVVDAVRELGYVRGADVMDRALLHERVTLDGLHAAAVEVLGRRGAPTVARLLPLAAGGARHAAERRLHRLLRRAGIGGWHADLPVELPGHGSAVLDVAFPGRRLVVEIDGWAFHSDPVAFRRDRRRQNALVLAGWTVLRVSWHDVVGEPARVLAEVRAALAASELAG